MRTSVPAAGLAALLLAAGAVSCSKGSGSEASPRMEPAAAVAEAARNTEDVSSFRYTMTGRVPGQGRVEAEASVRVEPDLAVSMKMSAPDAESRDAVEIRLVGKAMYLGAAGMTGETDGRSWMKFDLAALGQEQQLNELGAASQAEQNPVTQSTFLTGAKDVEKAGTEKVDGVETTRYSGTVTLDDLRASLREKDAEAAGRGEKSIEQYEKMGVEKLTMDMWVDGEDRTKQFRMRGDAPKGPLDMTITFLDVDQPVTVEAPPAADTVDLAEMTRGSEES